MIFSMTTDNIISKVTEIIIAVVLSQLMPSPEYPARQLHRKEPGRLVQFAFS